MDWLAARVDPVTSVNHNSITWFGELSRRHRFKQARNPSDYRGLMVKGPTERLPWTRAKPLAWDVPDTYAASHLQLTSMTACAAAEKAVVNKATKYVALSAMHSFVPVAIETSGAWCPQSVEFIEDLGRRITTIINWPLETAYLYQRMSVRLQRGNADVFRNTFPEH